MGRSIARRIEPVVEPSVELSVGDAPDVTFTSSSPGHFLCHPAISCVTRPLPCHPAPAQADVRSEARVDQLTMRLEDGGTAVAPPYARRRGGVRSPDRRGAPGEVPVSRCRVRPPR
jgi:hypothetical protein